MEIDNQFRNTEYIDVEKNYLLSLFKRFEGQQNNEARECGL